MKDELVGQLILLGPKCLVHCPKVWESSAAAVFFDGAIDVVVGLCPIPNH